MPRPYNGASMAASDGTRAAVSDSRSIVCNWLPEWECKNRVVLHQYPKNRTVSSNAVNVFTFLFRIDPFSFRLQIYEFFEKIMSLPDAACLFESGKRPLRLV